MSVIIDGSASVTINSGAVLGITSGTAVASTSGTSIDFTSIPSWVKRITVMFLGVSTNGSSLPQIQLGTSGGVVVTGYNSGASHTQNSSSVLGANSTTGILILGANGAAITFFGQMVCTLITGNTWVASVTTGRSDAATSNQGGGSIALGGTLDRIRITTVNGTDTFDAGSINILYE
jgi:hypothetical protein